MSAYSCKHSKQWPLNTLYKWFAQPGERAIADLSGATIGNESIVTVQATSNHYIRQITVEEVNALLDKVSNCSGCVNDLFGQATEFLNAHSEASSNVGALLYAATAYDRAQKCAEEGIELERVKKVLDQALSDYQQSHNEKCLHSVIKYRNVDVVKYLLKEHFNWSECLVEGCLPLKLAEGKKEILDTLVPQKALPLLVDSNEVKPVSEETIEIIKKPSLKLQNIANLVFDLSCKYQLFTKNKNDKEDLFLCVNEADTGSPKHVMLKII